MRTLQSTSDERVLVDSHSVGASIKNLSAVIVEEWINRVKKTIEESNHQSKMVLIDHMPEILNDLSKFLNQGSFKADELGKAHGFQRAISTAFSLEDLLKEYSLLRETLIDYLYPIGNREIAKRTHRYLDILSQNAIMEFLKMNHFFNRI